MASIHMFTGFNRIFSRVLCLMIHGLDYTKQMEFGGGWTAQKLMTPFRKIFSHCVVHYYINYCIISIWLSYNAERILDKMTER